jgi:hypothetical protein
MIPANEQILLCRCCSTPARLAAVDELNASLARLPSAAVRRELVAAVVRVLRLEAGAA